MLKQEFKLYFLHIPKTAGTSIRYWLWDAFAIDDFLECHRVVDLAAADASRLERARFYSGHFGPLLWERLARRPATVTMLREPVAQAFSTIRYLRTVPEEESRQWGGVGTWERPLFSELVRREEFHVPDRGQQGCVALVVRALQRAGMTFERRPADMIPADLAKHFRVMP